MLARRVRCSLGPSVTTSTWIGLIACTGHLGLALLASLRGGRSPLSLPLTLLCLDMLGWNAAGLAYRLSGEPAWHWLDNGLSPFTPPLTLLVVGTFVGRVHRLRRALVISLSVFGGLSVSSLLAFAWAPLDGWTHSVVWSVIYVAGAVPTFALALWLLVAHWRRASRVEERSRARLIFAAIAIGFLFGMTEFLDDFGLVVPPLASLGTLIATGLITTAALRLQLFERSFSRATLLYSFALALAIVLGYVAGFEWFGTNPGIVIATALILTLFLAAIVREVAVLRLDRAYRTQHLLTMGRFAAQMSHDLKNPLAALKGAIELLLEEHAQGRSLSARANMLDLMLNQVSRMSRVIEDYRRMARLEVERQSLDARDFVSSVLALQSLAPPAGVVVKSEVPEAPLECQLDPELLARALENLVRNALEAMPGGGALTVSLERLQTEVTGGVILSVADTGVGMDARQAARVFDDFYTTKAEGSGLGLSLVRRVAQAHGGHVELSSEPGRGTRVVLSLPNG